MAPARRYAFEALLIGEFGGATGFRFTGYHQPGTPPDQVRDRGARKQAPQYHCTKQHAWDTLPSPMRLSCRWQLA